MHTCSTVWFGELSLTSPVSFTISSSEWVDKKKSLITRVGDKDHAQIILMRSHGQVTLYTRLEPIGLPHALGVVRVLVLQNPKEGVCKSS